MILQILISLKEYALASATLLGCGDGAGVSGEGVAGAASPAKKYSFNISIALGVPAAPYAITSLKGKDMVVHVRDLCPDKQKIWSFGFPGPFDSCLIAFFNAPQVLLFFLLTTCFGSLSPGYAIYARKHPAFMAPRCIAKLLDSLFLWQHLNSKSIAIHDASI